MITSILPFARYLCTISRAAKPNDVCRARSEPMKALLSIRVLLVLSLAVMAAAMAGCSKKEYDPVEAVKSQIPEIVQALNTRDLQALKDLGTDRFEPESFVDDVYRHGVRGDVAPTFQRLRSLPGEAKLVVTASFGPNGSGGVKELTINFVGKDELKMDTYSLVDKVLPPPVNEDIMKKAPSDSAKPDTP